jgi:hypothetical protein
MTKGTVTKLAEALDSAGYEISSLKKTSSEDFDFKSFPYMIEVRMVSRSLSISEQLEEESMIKLVRAIASVEYGIVSVCFIDQEAELKIYPIFHKTKAES